MTTPAPAPATESPHQQAETAVMVAANKLGLQINGAVANAQAVSDAFNTFQAAFNQYQDRVKLLLAESEGRLRENKALHETVTELKTRLAAKTAKTDKEAPSQKPA